MTDERSRQADRVEVLALADRVECTTGPDRELDLRVKAIVYGGVPLVSPFNGEWCLYREGVIEARTGKLFQIPRNVRHEDWIADRYTASLDAAMTLVPEGCFARIFEDGAQAIIVRRFSGTFREVARGFAATPALALTAAALRARANQGDTHE